MRLVALALLALVAASVPASGAEPASTRLNVVAYHPYPETVPAADGGDPFGFPVLNASGRGVDWMAGYYGAYYYPTVRFDGVAEEANRADFSSASYVEAYRARVAERLREDAPVTLVLNGSRGANATLTVTAASTVNLSSERLVLRVAVVEDEIAFAGTNGVDLHRFVARQRLPDQVVAWSGRDGVFSFSVRYTFTPDPAWRGDSLGAVAWVQKEGEAARFEPREVVQSATLLFRQTVPTVQVEKSVLVEMYTATWCEACVFGDGAVEVLLAEMGIPARHAGAAWAYLREPPLARVALAVALAVPAAWLALRRWPA